jgi:hypothetical protein
MTTLASTGKHLAVAILSRRCRLWTTAGSEGATREGETGRCDGARELDKLDRTTKNSGIAREAITDVYLPRQNNKELSRRKQTVRSKVAGILTSGIAREAITEGTM